MKKTLSLAIVAFAAMSSMAHAGATCGGKPWTVDAFLNSECAGAQTVVQPGDNTPDRLDEIPAEEEATPDTGRV